MSYHKTIQAVGGRRFLAFLLILIVTLLVLFLGGRFLPDDQAKATLILDWTYKMLLALVGLVTGGLTLVDFAKAWRGKSQDE